MKQFNLEEYLANPLKKVVTRDGREVKIHCTNYHLSNQCVIAEIEGISRSFNQYGQPYDSAKEPSLDLFFATEKHEGWVNIFRSVTNGNSCYFIGNPSVFESKKDAEEAATEWSGYTSVKIEWEE